MVAEESPKPAEAGDRQTLSRNIRALYASRAISAVCGFLLVPLMVAHLGIADYGLLALSSAVFGYAGLFELGLTGAVTKYVAQHRGAKDLEGLQRVLTSAFTMALLSGLGAAAVLLVFLGLGPSALNVPPAQAQVYFLLLSLLLVRAPFAFALSLPEAVVRGFEDFQYTATVAACLAVANLVTMAAILVLGYGLAEIALAGVVLAGAPALLNAWRLGKAEPGLRYALTRHPLRNSTGFFRFAAAGTLLTLTGAAMYQADFIIVAAFLSTSAVGVYAIVSKLHQLVRELDWLSLQAVIPLVSRLEAEGKTEKTQALVKTGTRYLTAAEFSVVASLIAFAGPILSAWVGAEYAAWAWLAQIYLSFYLIQPLVNVAGYVLAGKGAMGSLVKVTVVTAVFKLALSLVLTAYLLSIAGTILGTVVSFALLLPYWLFTYARALEMPVRSLVSPATRSYSCAVVAFAFGWGFGLLFPTSPRALTFAGFVICILTSLAFYGYVFLNKRERQTLIEGLVGRRIALKMP